jgi:hypothetical protein
MFITHKFPYGITVEALKRLVINFDTVLEVGFHLQLYSTVKPAGDHVVIVVTLPLRTHHVTPPTSISAPRWGLARRFLQGKAWNNYDITLP